MEWSLSRFLKIASLLKAKDPEKGNGVGRSCWGHVRTSVFAAVLGASSAPLKGTDTVFQCGFSGLHSERTGLGFHTFGSGMYGIFEDLLGKDVFCILTFGKCSGYGGLVCQVDICPHEQVYVQHLALLSEWNLISKDIILCWLGTAALADNLIILGFCFIQQTRLSTNIYLSFYPLVIISALLFTLTWLDQHTYLFPLLLPKVVNNHSYCQHFSNCF